MTWKSAILTLLSLLACIPRAGIAEDFPPEANEFFEKQIRPILAERCLECHGEKKQEGKLQLTSRELLLKGGDRGAAIVPSKPAESLLVRAVEYLDEPKMPPKGKLTDADIAKLKRWVAMGAPWPTPRPIPNAPGDGSKDGKHRVTTAQQGWWAFQRIKDRSPPSVKNHSWTRNEIDRFVLAQLESRNMQPAPLADRRTWLRRVTFDLTGLPPTTQEIEAFWADDSVDAHEHVVDRLLALSAYGQKWARHWLDVARYADYHDGDPKARDARCEPLQAWRYRDWVVDSFNRDLPFDQFIVHQIAGDLLPIPEGQEFYADGLIATTFLSNGVWDRGDADKEKMVSDMVDDHVDTIGKAFMGLTLGCARCHDHKFDPISQNDYYGLAGIFYSTRILKELGAKGDNYTLHRVPLAAKGYVEKRDDQVRRLNEFKAKLAELDKQSKPADDPERKSVIAQRDAVQSELLPEPPMAEAAAEGGIAGGLFPNIQDVPLHIRGSYTRLGPVVPRRMPAFFAGESQTSITSGSGRRELAHWVASRDNPLTARVIVNRVWSWHFGAGLVRTPNNFGLLSEPPSHPELLDWLAARFLEDGWSLKKLHRRIVLSATYRQASSVGGLGSRVEGKEHPSTLDAQLSSNVDSDNRWLGRFTARRLEAEEIRDAMLQAAGSLDGSLGGPASDNLSIARRSLYVQTARWDRGSFAMLFDAANPDASDEKRHVSVVAPQALFLLNNSFALAQAKQLAKRLIREIPATAQDYEAARIERVYRLLFGRSPSIEETAIARRTIAFADPSSSEGVWSDFAHVLLCSNEFVYLD